MVDPEEREGDESCDQAYAGPVDGFVELLDEFVKTVGLALEEGVSLGYDVMKFCSRGQSDLLGLGFI